MHPSRDGKLRYDQSVREEMFSFLTGEFKKHSSEWKTFLCMEAPETWLSAMGGLPKAQTGLEDLFDHRVIRKFDQQIEKRENI